MQVNLKGAGLLTGESPIKRFLDETPCKLPQATGSNKIDLEVTKQDSFSSLNSTDNSSESDAE
jgi:hypothetical protein